MAFNGRAVLLLILSLFLFLSILSIVLFCQEKVGNSTTTTNTIVASHPVPHSVVPKLDLVLKGLFVNTRLIIGVSISVLVLIAVVSVSLFFLLSPAEPVEVVKEEVVVEPVEEPINWERYVPLIIIAVYSLISLVFTVKAMTTKKPSEKLSFMNIPYLLLFSPFLRLTAFFFKRLALVLERQDDSFVKWIATKWLSLILLFPVYLPGLLIHSVSKVVCRMVGVKVGSPFGIETELLNVFE